MLSGPASSQPAQRVERVQLQRRSQRRRAGRGPPCRAGRGRRRRRRSRPADPRRRGRAARRRWRGGLPQAAPTSAPAAGASSRARATRASQRRASGAARRRCVRRTDEGRRDVTRRRPSGRRPAPAAPARPLRTASHWSSSAGTPPVKPSPPSSTGPAPLGRPSARSRASPADTVAHPQERPPRRRGRGEPVGPGRLHRPGPADCHDRRPPDRLQPERRLEVELAGRREQGDRVEVVELTVAARRRPAPPRAATASRPRAARSAASSARPGPAVRRTPGPRSPRSTTVTAPLPARPPRRSAPRATPTLRKSSARSVG